MIRAASLGVPTSTPQALSWKDTCDRGLGFAGTHDSIPLAVSIQTILLE
jgi:hypothetical protein